MHNWHLFIAGGVWGLALAGPALAQQPGAPGAAMATSTPAASQSLAAGVPAAEQMVDLAPNHWAYNAIKVLMERYRVVGGFPDKTFRGEKGVSRYELAAALAQIMDKIQARGDERIAPSDRDLVEKLRKEFIGELAGVAVIRTQTENLGKKTDEIAKKTDKIAIDVDELKTWKTGFVMPKATDKVKGRIDTSIMDDPEDKLFPYWVASARISLKGKIRENVSGSFSLSGGQSARQISVSPAIAGADKPPTPDIKLGGTAAITADFPGDFTLQSRFGSYGIGGLMDLKGYAGHWGDGIIGTGLVEPSANPTRGGRDMALGTKVNWKGLSLATGVTSQLAAAYAGWDWDWGNINFIADTDHDSVNLEKVLAVKGRDRPYSMATSLNFGSEKLGIMMRGGVKGTGNVFGEAFQPYGALQAVYNIAGVELCAGTDFKQGPEKTNPTQQLRPAAYIFVPQLHPALPTFLVGLVDVETIAGKKTGPGSLLGDKAGITVQLGYDNPILPNLTLEADYSQDVLFSDKYDGWGYALSTGIEF